MLDPLGVTFCVADDSSNCLMVYKSGGAPAVFRLPKCARWRPPAEYRRVDCHVSSLQGRRRSQEDRAFCALNTRIPFPENMVICLEDRVTGKCLRGYPSDANMYNIKLRIIDFGSAINEFTINHLYGSNGPSRLEETVEYTSPEAMLNISWSRGSPDVICKYDMWSVGVVMMELILGSPHVFQISSRTRSLLDQYLDGWTMEARELAYKLRAFMEMCILVPGGSPLHQSTGSKGEHGGSWLASWKCTEEAFSEQVKARDPLKLGFPDIWYLRLVRQLLIWHPGFRKVDPDRWEFAIEGFVRGQKHLLINIKRRKPPSQVVQQQAVAACVEVGHFGLEGELDMLKRDKTVLMAELVKLRQQQQNTRDYLRAMEDRIQGTEQKQQQMMTFLARAMQNPTFVMQMLQQNEKRKELEEAISKKRRRPIEGRPEEEDVRGLNDVIEGLEAQEEANVGMVSGGIEDQYELDLSELERLESELKGEITGDVEEEEEVGAEDESSGFEFLEELWGENVREEQSIVDGVRSNDADVKLLTEKLGFLGSSPKRQRYWKTASPGLVLTCLEALDTIYLLFIFKDIFKHLQGVSRHVCNDFSLAENKVHH